MMILFFFSSRRRHTRSLCDWSSDVCSSDLSGVGSGIAISGILVLALNKLLPMGYVAGWRADWIGMAILATVLLIPCWAWIPRSESEAARPRARPESITSRARGRVVLTYLLLLSVAYFLEGTG